MLVLVGFQAITYRLQQVGVVTGECAECLGTEAVIGDGLLFVGRQSRHRIDRTGTAEIRGPGHGSQFRVGPAGGEYGFVRGLGDGLGGYGDGGRNAGNHGSACYPHHGAIPSLESALGDCHLPRHSVMGNLRWCSKMTVPVLVGVDWGTTNARAYVLDANGSIMAQTDDHVGGSAGIMHVRDADFPEAFNRLIEALPLMPPVEVPVVLSGMITSRQGWFETPYVDCPASIGDVTEVAEIQHHEDRTLIFAPGLTYEDETGVHDVMRGEELQVLGALAGGGNPAEIDVFCLPGTHSKWVWAAGERIDRFRTVMTGEVFSALCNHTILGRLMGARSHDAAAFLQGAELGQAGGYVLHDIFAARTQSLFDELRPDALAAYLSGLLIGHEVAAMAGSLDSGTVVGLIGGAALADRYRVVLELAGFKVETLDNAVVTTRGQLALARAMNKVGLG